MEFTYDDRGRLIREHRYGIPGERQYDLSYYYEQGDRGGQGGNRTRKLDAINNIQVDYYYDISNPSLYQSNNNRLEYYETSDVSDPKNPLLLSTTWYYYNDSGNVTRVVTNQDGTNDYSATRLRYARNGQTVSYVINETWTWDGNPPNCPTAYNVAFAREFRYDGARQRYLNRDLDPAALMKGDRVALAETWTDYDGDEPYGDYSVTPANPPYPPVVTYERSFELGVGTVDPWTASDGITTSYYHGDLIGTTRHMTDGSGNPASSATYTAFGERIDGTNQRYGYAGAWGYQSHDEFPFLHVGARYYDPATGRFLQRDPIGIRGGTNVYVYVFNLPTVGVDPSGNGFWDGNNRFHRWVARNFWMRVHSAKTLAEMSDLRAYAEAIGLSVVGGVLIYHFGGMYGVRYLPVRFSLHAVERMMQYSIPGSAVINAIRHGIRTAGNRPGTWTFVYENVTVVVNACGNVLTVWKTGH